jgi:hypothetical protein
MVAAIEGLQWRRGVLVAMKIDSTCYSCVRMFGELQLWPWQGEMVAQVDGIFGGAPQVQSRDS